ncbi:hypothetical protein HRbin16_01002 [bacterium HR16]|nr:hypothetical protein HRbin16_01002 [bacterium HR16]
MPTLHIDTDQLLELLLQLDAAERWRLLVKFAEGSRAQMEETRAFAEERLRHLSAERGLDWDSLTEEQREDFVEELLDS